MRRTRSIEIPVTWHKLRDDTVVSVRCDHDGLQTERTTVLQPCYYTREERLEQQRGADPRTEQTTTREPDWGNPCELRRPKS